MARGLDKHRERMEILSSFGKELARRSKSKCELCDASGVKLIPFEVEPAPATPELEHCILICESCASQVSDPRRFEAGEHWRCLAANVWSEIPAVQVVAMRLLKRLAESQAWARETLDEVYLDEEVEDWVTKAG